MRRIWSVHFNECLCQWYDVNKVEKITDAVLCEDFFAEYFPAQPKRANFEYCDDLVGFSAEAWAREITPWGKESIDYYNDSCK